jgi:hypothetical protein
MAGSVLSRTCFFSRVGGTIRPHEWCVINHSTFGPMVEPFWPFATNMISLNQGTKINDDFSSTNEFQRVDEFVEVDDAGLIKSLNSGSQTTWPIGGRNYPRSGR